MSSDIPALRQVGLTWRRHKMLLVIMLPGMSAAGAGEVSPPKSVWRFSDFRYISGVGMPIANRVVRGSKACNLIVLNRSRTSHFGRPRPYFSGRERAKSRSKTSVLELS